MKTSKILDQSIKSIDEVKPKKLKISNYFKTLTIILVLACILFTSSCLVFFPGMGHGGHGRQGHNDRRH